MLTPPLLLSLVLSAPFSPAYSTKAVDPRGSLTLAAGILSEPLQGDLRLAARAFALFKRAELGLPQGTTLADAEAFGTAFGASFHLPQRLGELEIFEAKVIVTIDRDRRVRQLASSAVSYSRAVVQWNVPLDRALQTAAGSVQWPVLGSNGQPKASARRMLFPRGSEVHAGYYVSVPTLDPSANWLVAVSAVTGEILFQRNKVFHASADADVYAHSPGGLDAGIGVTALERVQLLHADGGSMIADQRGVPLPDGGEALVPNDAGYLSGSQIDAYNCCPNLGCDSSPDAGPRRAAGVTNYGGMTINYDMAICDRVQRANNDPALHTSGDYVYAPIDAPTGAVSQSSLPDSDEFAEVHAFAHVNRVFDWFRELSTSAAPIFPGQSIPPLLLAGEKLNPPRKLTVWTNITIPDFNTINIMDVLLGGTARTDTLARMDNAAFMPRENFQQLPIPGLALNGDALMIFQGTQADFAYDAPVVWHEFGHAVIHATANFSAFIVDERSANSEGGALHEGFADYFAAAYGQRSAMGEYVGPRTQGAGGNSQLPQDVGFRNANNSFACPEVLWGEVHQDSQHVVGALWQARQTIFQGADLGRTFDQAVYAALVSMTPATSFEQAATAVTTHVGLAFPGISGAEQNMLDVFTQRGVIDCSKIVDMTGVSAARPYYAIGGRQQAGVSSGVVPGPYQMKLRVPAGARSVKISAPYQSGGFGGGGTPPIKLLAKANQPVTFTRASGVLSNDADVKADAVLSGSTLSAEAFVDAPCGETSEVYFTLGTDGTDQQALQNLKVSFTPLAVCPVDAGTPAAADAGPAIVDGLGGNGVTAQGSAPTGCGCGAGASMAFALLPLLALLRRRQS